MYDVHVKCECNSKYRPGGSIKTQRVNGSGGEADAVCIGSSGQTLGGASGSWSKSIPMSGQFTAYASAC